MRKKPKIFYGWVIVLACMILSACGTGLLSYMTSLFVKPVTEWLGVSRSTFAVSTTIATVVTVVVMPFVGGWYQKFPFKRLLLAGSLLGGSALFLYSFAANIYVFYAVAALAGLGLCVIGAMPIVVLTANWFVKKRGVATGIAFTGSGIASMIFAPVVTRMIDSMGWQWGYRLLGIVFFALMLPTIFFLIKEKPEDMGLTAYGARENEAARKQPAQVGFTRAQVLRTKAFWLFAVAIFLISAVSMGTQQQLVSFWSDLGNSLEKAAAAYSVMMAVGIAAKALLGAVYDKFKIAKASVIICAVGVLAMLSLALMRWFGLLFVSAFLFGLSTAIQIVPPTYMTNKLFGDKQYSAIYGVITTIFYCGVSVGVPFSAAVYDNTGSYFPAWWVFLGAIVVLCGLMLAANRFSKKEFQSILHMERPE